ncbi:hypothetical protein [Niallia sp. 03133]|uniref:hypothetical protein n=1 Tax=Niallia sp. 03133 TaxID=3458060 RepID=UPI0040443721
MVFKRILENKTILVIHNLTSDEKQLTLSDNDQSYNHIYFTTNVWNNVKYKVYLQPYSTVILDSKS